jgi:ribosomal protein S8
MCRFKHTLFALRLASQRKCYTMTIKNHLVHSLLLQKLVTIGVIKSFQAGRMLTSIVLSYDASLSQIKILKLEPKSVHDLLKESVRFNGAVDLICTDRGLLIRNEAVKQRVGGKLLA